MRCADSGNIAGSVRISTVTSSAALPVSGAMPPGSDCGFARMIGFGAGRPPSGPMVGSSSGGTGAPCSTVVSGGCTGLSSLKARAGSGTNRNNTAAIAAGRKLKQSVSNPLLPLLTTFGTTGKLRNSDLVMYDRETESWWQQFTGEAITGSRTGTQLEIIPSRLESWQSFKGRHPDGEVLVPNNPGFRDYGRNPYAGYDSSAVPFLYRGSMPEGISPLSYVVVIRDGPKPMAVSLDWLRREGSVEQDGIDIVWVPGVRSALDTADIGEGREIGSVSVTRDGEVVAHELTFAFVVHAFLPDTDVLK